MCVCVIHHFNTLLPSRVTFKYDDKIFRKAHVESGVCQEQCSGAATAGICRKVVEGWALRWMGWGGTIEIFLDCFVLSTLLLCQYQPKCSQSLFLLREIKVNVSSAACVFRDPACVCLIQHSWPLQYSTETPLCTYPEIRIFIKTKKSPFILVTIL